MHLHGGLPEFLLCRRLNERTRGEAEGECGEAAMQPFGR